MSQIITATLLILEEADGTVHVPSVSLPVELNCIDEFGNVLKSSLQVVFLVYDEGAGTLTENTGWVTGAIVATKITNRCTGDVVYAATPINDVVGAQNPCCSGSFVFPPNYILTEDGQQIQTEGGAPLITE